MSALPILVSPEAELDFDRFLASLETHSKRAATRSRVRVERILQQLAAGLEGREVLLLDGRRVRRWVVDDDLVIYYQRTSSALEVARIRHARATTIEDV